MLTDIVEVKPLEEYRLFLRFDDGTAGEIDMDSIVRFEGVFAPLRDRAVFAQVRVNAELGTIVWPNGADLCADVLHAKITGGKLPGAERAKKAG
ncbi:MAG: DUF2442 domain-containing protein [Alphaproteobacteria bacterium]|nr:DUF2442 domain-containing protein [Alphaproteobacteria bacterium]